MAKQVSPPVNDLILVLFSLALGFMVWVIVKQNEIQTQTKLVPVYYENLPSYIQLDENNPYTPDRLAVSFSYPKGEETIANSGEFRITVDLSQMGERVSSIETFSPHPVRITRQMIEYPPQLTLLEFVSETEVVFNARRMVATARVIPNIAADEPAEGFEIIRENIVVEPDEVPVVVDRIRFELSQQQPLTILTEKIEVAGKSETVHKRVGLVFNREAGIFPLPGEAAPAVEVFVPIAEISSTRTFQGIPISYEPLKRGVRAELIPESANVTITGPASLLSLVTAEVIQLTPRPSEFLDDEIVGESFETVIDAAIDITNERFAREVRLQVEPAQVNVRFYSSEPETTEEPAPTPAPPPTRSPTMLPRAPLTPGPEPNLPTTDTLLLLPSNWNRDVLAASLWRDTAAR